MRYSKEERLHIGKEIYTHAISISKSAEKTLITFQLKRRPIAI